MCFCFCSITGDTERVEMVIDDVVVEVSKHRGIGRMYLTNFRSVRHTLEVTYSGTSI